MIQVVKCAGLGGLLSPLRSTTCVQKEPIAMYGDKPVVLGSRELDERLVELVLGFRNELTYAG